MKPHANANAAQTAQATTSPGPDNSEITTSVDASGTRTETRTFRDNPRVSESSGDYQQERHDEPVKSHFAQR